MGMESLGLTTFHEMQLFYILIVCNLLVGHPIHSKIGIPMATIATIHVERQRINLQANKSVLWRYIVYKIPPGGGSFLMTFGCLLLSPKFGWSTFNPRRPHPDWPQEGMLAGYPSCSSPVNHPPSRQLHLGYFLELEIKIRRAQPIFFEPRQSKLCYSEKSLFFSKKRSCQQHRYWITKRINGTYPHVVPAT